MAETQAKSRLVALDGLRGLAALAVVLYHFGFRVAEIYPDVGVPIHAVYFGQYGVQLFFAISGFVIFLSLQGSTPTNFVIMRFIRLYPIYWVCGLITFSVVSLFGLPGRGISIADALVNASMIQGYLGVPHIDGAYWTLAAEVGFYIQVGALFFFGLLAGRRLVMTLYLWLILATIASQLHRFVSSPVISETLASLGLGLKWIPLFIAGIVFYRIWVGERSVAILGLLPLTVIIMSARSWELGIATLVVFAIFSVALWGPQSGRFARPFIFLGGISYPLYLIHQNVGYVLIRWFTSFEIVHWLAAVMSVLCVVAIASALAVLVDAPLRRALRRWLRRQPHPTRATTASVSGI